MLNENKHLINLEGYSPRKFAEKFVKTNYFYQREVIKKLIKEYQKEAEGDKNRPSKKNSSNMRIQLVSGLESLIESLKGPVMGALNKVYKACSNYMKNPYHILEK